jgi:3-dehydroquinate synthase
MAVPVQREPVSFDVPLSVPFRHRVLFTRGVFRPENTLLRSVMSEGTGARAVVFVDDGVMRANPSLEPAVRAAFAGVPGMPELAELAAVTGGERAKQDLSVVDRVVESVERHRIDRQSYVVAIGGGAVLDAVGFGAAIAHRGVRLLRLPTTTLAQGDAGMAVKNGVNRFGKKNFVGAFAVPHAVVCDEELLKTSPDWSWCGGFSECVKIALLRDSALFDRLERDAAAIRARSMAAAMPVLVRSAELHWRHIALGGDPFETRSARPLDYGHWLAHRLEGITDGELPHGQAVAIGVAVDTAYSACIGLLAEAEARRVIGVLRALGLPTTHAALADRSAVQAGLEEFREHLGGRLTITLLRGVGDAVDVHDFDGRGLDAAIAMAAGTSI